MLERETQDHQGHFPWEYREVLKNLCSSRGRTKRSLCSCSSCPFSLVPMEQVEVKTPAPQTDDQIPTLGSGLGLSLIMKWKDIQYCHSFSWPQFPWL